ncbi:hypothetical protein KM043_014849 [Ampulex compressa]|nr:hypothetical protein KM043_014849 [Ampulex compressa]
MGLGPQVRLQEGVSTILLEEKPEDPRTPSTPRETTNKGQKQCGGLQKSESSKATLPASVPTKVPARPG